MRPNPLIARAYVVRGAKLWAVTRAALSLAFALAGENPIRFSTAAMVGVMVLSVSLGYFDVRMRRESTLLGNLGVSASHLAAFFAAPALVGEVLLWSLAVGLA